MVKFEFYLRDEDFDKMCEIKQQTGKDSLTLNEFAKEILEKELRRLYAENKKRTN